MFTLVPVMTLFFFPSIINAAAEVNKNEIITLEVWEYHRGDMLKDSSGKYVFPDSEASEWIASNKGSLIPAEETGGTAWFRTKLPELKSLCPAVFVNRAQQVMTVYLDGREIYSNSGFLQNSGSPDALSFRWYLIRLPQDYSGKYLYFRFYSESKKIGMSTPVSLGSADAFLYRIVSENSDIMFIGGVIILTGIIMMTIFIFFKRTRFFLALTVFSYATGVFICINNPYINLLTGNLDLLNFLNSFSLFLQPVLFMVVEELVIDRYKKILGIMWKIHVGYILLTLVLTPFPGITIVDLEDPFLIMLIFNSNFSIFTLFKSISRERIEAVILLSGTIIFSFMGTAEILLYYFNFYSDTWYTTTYIFHWGAFIFIICLVVLTGYRYLKDVKEKESIQLQVVQQQKLALDAMHREKKLQEEFTHQLMQSQDNERKRIAMELHDAIGQDLLIIKNMALLSLKHNNGSSSKDTECINDISETASNVIEHVRNMSRNLHPYQLENLGLSDALEAIINRVENSSEISFRYEIDDINGLFSRENEVHIYRILQESINNIIKHSGSDSAEVKIVRDVNVIKMMIKDNGRGFKAAGVKETLTGTRFGFGITGIHERVGILGGEIKIISGAVKGTTLDISIPFESRASV